MGCAIKKDFIGIDISKKTDKFSGVILRFAREYKGYTLEDLAKKMGLRYSYLLELETGLRQPTRYDMTCILAQIDSFTEDFYFCKTYTRDKPLEVFMCGKGIAACSNCGSPADYLCDYPVGEGKTCSLPVCGQCRTYIGKYDFCPIHREANKVIQLL